MKRKTIKESHSKLKLSGSRPSENIKEVTVCIHSLQGSGNDFFPH